MSEPNVSEDGTSPRGSRPEEPAKKTYDELPKCFRALAAFRQDINTKRVLRGDTRRALWKSLDELVIVTSELAVSLKASHGISSNSQEDVTFLQGRFDNVLAAFHVSKDDYEKLDADLCVLDHRLANEEMRIYNHLETGDAPPPSVYNRSFPLLSISDDPPSRDDLTFGESSVDGTDLYEVNYGLGNSVGEYPRLIADQDLFSDSNQPGYLLAPEYPLDDPESPVLSGPPPEPHPLILGGCSSDHLGSCLLPFNSNGDRVNTWLLHILRSSGLEIERLRNSHKGNPRSITMDETAWAKHVLDAWSRDNLPGESGLDLEPGSASISENAESLRRNSESKTLEKPGDGRLNDADASASYSVIPFPEDLVSSGDKRQSSNVNQGREANRNTANPLPHWPGTHHDQWLQTTATLQALPRILQTFCQWMFHPIKWTLEKNRGRSRTRKTTGPTVEAGSETNLVTHGTRQRADIHDSAHQITSSLKVSPLRKANGTCQRDSTISSGSAVYLRESRPHSATISGSVQKRLTKDWTVHPTKPILSASHTKLFSVGQVFLISFKSLVVPDPKEPCFHFSIFKEIFPSFASFIAIEVNQKFGFLSACPILKDANQRLNLLQNKYRDLVVCSDISGYPTQGEIHVQLTSSAYTFPAHEQLRLNSTVKFIIPFGVATLGIGHVDPYDIQKVSHDPESPAKHVDYIPRTLFPTPRPHGSDEMYSRDKGYAASATYTEPESIWNGISTDPDGLEPLHYSTIID